MERMRGCLHPELAKRRVKDTSGSLHEVPTEDMLADVAAGPKTTQLEALKYTAFSYCVTSRQALCRQRFPGGEDREPKTHPARNRIFEHADFRRWNPVGELHLLRLLAHHD